VQPIYNNSISFNDRIALFLEQIMALYERQTQKFVSRNVVEDRMPCSDRIAFVDRISFHLLNWFFGREIL